MVTLTLNCDNRTAAKTITGKFGADVKVDVPTKTGYTFSAWNPELPVTFPAEDTQYTAKWVKESDCKQGKENGLLGKIRRHQVH